MNLCHAPLAYSFTKPFWQLWGGYAFGLMGILGWGLGFELIFRKKTKSFGFYHAFLEGTVISSFILLILSTLGFWQTAWPVAFAGIAIGFASLFVVWRNRKN